MVTAHHIPIEKGYSSPMNVRMLALIDCCAGGHHDSNTSEYYLHGELSASRYTKGPSARRVHISVHYMTAAHALQ